MSQDKNTKYNSDNSQIDCDKNNLKRSKEEEPVTTHNVSSNQTWKKFTTNEFVSSFNEHLKKNNEKKTLPHKGN